VWAAWLIENTDDLTVTWQKVINSRHRPDVEPSKSVSPVKDADPVALLEHRFSYQITASNASKIVLASGMFARILGWLTASDDGALSGAMIMLTLAAYCFAILSMVA
jgi:hypothetical protein